MTGWKWLIALGAFAALIAAGWYVSHVIARNAELELQNRDQAAQIGTYRAEAKAEQESANRLAGIHKAIEDQTAQLQVQINSQPLTRTVVREVQVKGETVSVPCVERDAERYFSLFNAALEGADATAPGVPEPLPGQ